MVVQLVTAVLPQNRVDPSNLPSADARAWDLCRAPRSGASHYSSCSGARTAHGHAHGRGHGGPECHGHGHDPLDGGVLHGELG